MHSGTLDISEARRKIGSLSDRVRREQVIRVTRHGKDAFAIVDIDYLSTVMETLDILADPEALKMLQDSISDIRAGRLHDHEDVKKELL